MNIESVKMVDISNKSSALREATAEAQISLSSKTIRMIRDKKIPKGEVLSVAECAGILAAKRVEELIPLCHPLPLEYISIDFKFKRKAIIITARCKTNAKTGVEMEAMVASAIAALTIYDMCKSLDREAVIEEIKLMEKKGGKSGDYIRNSKFKNQNEKAKIKI